VNGNVPPQRYVEVAVGVPSPDSHSNVRLSAPGSVAVAVNLIPLPAIIEFSPTVQFHVSGCLTLKVWCISICGPESKVMFSQAEVAPLDYTLTLSSWGVYAILREMFFATSLPTSNDVSCGLLGWRVSVARMVSFPPPAKYAETSCHFSPAILRVAIGLTEALSETISSGRLSIVNVAVALLVALAATIA
jgi:hypothetical protein